MLHIFTGSDFQTITNKKDNLISSLETKRPDARRIHLEPDTPHLLSTLQEQLSSLGLFDSKSIITGTALCEDADTKKYLIKHAEQFAHSDNAFVLYESQLNKKDIDTLTQAGATLHQYNTAITPSKNLFHLADLLCEKNKSRLWSEFNNELLRGTSPEEGMGILLFQARALHLSLTHTQAESSLKAFVYNKCSKSPWKVSEATRSHLELVRLYHQSRRGGLKLEERIERFILKLPR